MGNQPFLWEKIWETNPFYGKKYGKPTLSMGKNMGNQPFLWEKIWETMAFFLGGYHIFRHHFFQIFKHRWSSKARPHHLLLPPGAVARKHPMRNLCLAVYDSAAVLPHSLWQSVAIYFIRMEHQKTTTGKLETGKLDNHWKMESNWKTGKPLDTTGNQRWKPPWKPSWLGRKHGPWGKRRKWLMPPKRSSVAWLIGAETFRMEGESI